MVIYFWQNGATFTNIISGSKIKKKYIYYQRKEKITSSHWFPLGHKFRDLLVETVWPQHNTTMYLCGGMGSFVGMFLLPWSRKFSNRF